MTEVNTTMRKIKQYCIDIQTPISDWEPLPNEEFDYCGDAIIRAHGISLELKHGSIRVVDLDVPKVVEIFPAGGPIRGRQV